MSTTKTITVAHGDGIGPEIMEATLKILDAANANLDYESIEIGEKVYRKGIKSGIEDQNWDIISKNNVLLKAPITTPQGGGVKSLNVTLRKTLGLFANVRPCRAYHPFVKTKHPDMDVVVIRENEEDTYGGIEHRQTYEVYQCLKLITLPGTERIVRYAFEYAKSNGRRKITCFTKDNIMKLTDGLFHDVFKTVAQEYPDIESENLIIDIGTARLADTPEKFDVVVMPNLYGDIVSDITAQISGSVGMVGSANIGTKTAMFEAIHGSAPDIAGQNIANPSALIQAAVMMLRHIGRFSQADNIHNAWLRTLEDGVHTPDIYSAESKKKVTTQEFTQAVIDRLDQKPVTLASVSTSGDVKVKMPELKISRSENRPSATQKRTLSGVDVFVYWEPDNVNLLAQRLKGVVGNEFELTMITNRGTKVWPNANPETFCTDHWRCRFKSKNGKTTQFKVVDLQKRLTKHAVDIIKTENLYLFDNEPAFSSGQGES
ncbi:NADP-dependent isocitrate dehydrogenase [Rhodohalobacter barkolensis]|uniref:Isocitrate dehydrogenase [NADP] n=1 Tax=Rhodohalobacter barkolensis TaxID=2053187 RepID=A0A2N0VMI0_9BACT|nr:NADP-dependent isocitrate dehydrogenase [Rhodohalobacter barkolensis]PKD45400.1 isocitrate dehydrogenase [Rhodohalobacter barkolensis]